MVTVISAVLFLTPMSVFSYGYTGYGGYHYTIHPEHDKPTSSLMIVDTILARPLLLAATIIGTTVFFIALPFTLSSGSVAESRRHLVDLPAKATFQRCLGCTFINPEEANYER